MGENIVNIYGNLSLIYIYIYIFFFLRERKIKAIINYTLFGWERKRRERKVFGISWLLNEHYFTVTIKLNGPYVHN